MSDLLTSSAEAGRLEGQMLIAMPTMSDQRFSRSLIYLCAHSEDGAMGIIVNKRSRSLKFTELLVQLEVIGEGDAIALPPRVGDVPVLRGGPVERGRGFVLHSPDYHASSATLTIDQDVSLTATVDILRALAAGHGPRRAVLALGYAGWASGQLEQEIQQNGWLTCAADESLVFGEDHASKYDRALRKLGIDPALLVSDAGHA
ncbi:MAG: YqgE/AlgH family protein [Beijerinckiaceae bacterium]|nr:YqgE/AlgH family protein [Beijerinckiaceae bacterium]